VSKYTTKHIDNLLNNSAIIRNKLKINSAINNAQQFLKVQKEFGSFDKYIWSFVNHKPINNNFKKHVDLPASTDISKKMSKNLKNYGFNFVGPTICYAFMQAVGMVNDHTCDCFLHK
jgi:DNA-3-methyladenine glycosylase I